MAIIENFQALEEQHNELQAIRQLQVYDGKINQILTYAKNYEVVSNWSAEEAITLGGEAKALAKSIDNARKTITDPARRFVNKINDTARIFTDKLEQVEEIIKRKVATWKKAEAEKLAIEAESAKDLMASLDLDIEPFVEKAPKYVRGDGAMSYEQTVWKFDVEDLSITPREYLTIDEAKVKAAVKSGVREIPGLKIYSEQKTIIKSR
jgi:hypothetical protein